MLQGFTNARLALVSPPLPPPPWPLSEHLIDESVLALAPLFGAQKCRNLCDLFEPSEASLKSYFR